MAVYVTNTDGNEIHSGAEYIVNSRLARICRRNRYSIIMNRQRTWRDFKIEYEGGINPGILE